MYGWRARCGLILPVDNTVMEPELYGLAIPGVSFHAARLNTTERSRMPEQGMDLAPLFDEMGVDAVVYACAETSFLGGIDANRVIIDRISAATSLPAVTATWAMVLALRHVSASRIALVTPYTEPRGRVMEEFLGRSGIEVAVSRHRDFHAGSADAREWYETNSQPPSTAYRMVRELGPAGVDAVLISATNFRTFEIVEPLERDLGVPVISCNQAILWWLGSELKLDGVPPFGSLGRA
jgi:maleate isomerase